MSKILISILFVILLSVPCFSQYIGFEEIDDSKVSDWNESNMEAYQGAYHFGDSEMESTLLIICSEGKVIAQLQDHGFDKNYNWITVYTTFKNVRIEENRFYSSKSNGEFVIYNKNGKNIKGLKIYKPWSYSDDRGYEIGTFAGDEELYFSGKYPQASLRFLESDELKKMSKQELKIMRNEIFARYGYKFIPNGAMDQYFRKQKWYKPTYKNVMEFLTEIELQNIKLIRDYE